MALLATALAVALAGDGGDAAPGLAEPSGGEAQVDAGQDVLDALGLVLDAPGVQQHAGRRGAPDLGRLLDPGGRHPGHLLPPPRVGLRHALRPRRSKPTVWSRMKSWSSQSRSMRTWRMAAHERRVGARTQTQEHVCGAGDGGDPRVGDDQPGAAVACPPDVAGGDGGALGDVRPGHEDHVGEGDVAPRVGGAVDAERLHVGLARRDHAEASVVVEVRGADPETGELAHEVGLLVRERHPREDGEGIGAVLGLDASDLRGDPVEGPIPVERAEPAGCGRVPLERVEQPVGVGVLEVALHALGAELALVEGEVVPGLEPHDLLVADLEDDAALLAAEAAVRLDRPVDLTVALPPSGRCGVEVGSVPGDQLLLGDRGARHQPKPPTRWDWARVTRRRRQVGQWSW